jgi:hypothetical protein
MVDVFSGGTVLSDDDMASPNFAMGSTVAYARLRMGWRKMGRAEARRRDVVGRREVIVSKGY